MHSGSSSFRRRSLQDLNCLTSGEMSDEWVEQKVAYLLNNSGQYHPPVELTPALLKLCRVIQVNYIRGLPEVGRLQIRKSGFVVDITPTSAKEIGWDRVVLAHEVAHSLLYDVSSWPPKSLVSYRAGHWELEAICSYFARCLLVPKVWLIGALRDISREAATMNRLKSLDLLAKRFNVPWRLLAKRLVEDLECLDCVILKFSCSALRNSGGSGEPKPDWRLTWCAVPPYLRESVYIPFGRKVHGKRKCPRVKGRISRVIGECTTRSLFNEFFTLEVGAEELVSSTTGGLGKFISTELGLKRVELHCRSGIRSHTSLFSEPPGFSGGEIVLSILLPNQQVSRTAMDSP